MRSCHLTMLLMVLGIVLGLGCNRDEEARRKALENNLKQLGLALQNYHQKYANPTAESWNVIGVQSPYYHSGPHQARPPDGWFPAGTWVSIVEDAGSYMRVTSAGGITAYVEANAVDRQKALTTDLPRIVEGGNTFALELYQQLRSTEGNLFFSPASISTALAMTYAGAAGVTEADMAHTLHVTVPKDPFHDGMQTLQAYWTTPDEKSGIRLNLANRLWGQVGYPFRPAFLEVTRVKYGAELAQLEFAQSADASQSINKWIEDQTQGKIANLISPDALSTETRLVLTNAVYFHGNWARPFESDETEDEDFHLTPSAKTKVSMMHRGADYRYGAVDDLQILELPYGDGSLAMVVLLPKEIDGLVQLEANLKFDNLRRWMASVQDENEVIVSLPKFKTTAKFLLSGTLRAMGMESAFDPNAADFSGMSEREGLFISAVIHKAFVDVNEEGTEAAAATGVTMMGGGIEPKEPPIFRADHPFVFMIRDNRNGSILFLGRITNPMEPVQP